FWGFAAQWGGELDGHAGSVKRFERMGYLRKEKARGPIVRADYGGVRYNKQDIGDSHGSLLGVEMREYVGTRSAKLGLGQSVLVRFLLRKTLLSSQHGVLGVSKRSGYVGVQATITKHECATCPRSHSCRI